MTSLRTRRAATAGMLAAGALAAGAAPTSAATQVGVTSSAVTRAFSFYASPNSAAKTLFRVDGLTLNARCNAAGSPIVFAFSAGTGGDLLGRMFDGAGRVHIIHNTSFDKRNHGVQLNPSSTDYDVSGAVAYEDVNSRVVTVNLTMDNSTTLSGRRVCTVYGSFIAS